MRFIENPGLPDSKVALCAVSRDAREVIGALSALGIAILEIEPAPALALPVASHADMLLHPLGGKGIVIAKGQSALKVKLESFGFCAIESEKPLEEAYPQNIALNCARAGKRLFALEKAMDTHIKDYCENNHILIHSVRQGYAKCSVCVVGADAVITADASIAAAAEQAGLDVLRIREGYITLPGYSHGFIGGCCGRISGTVLAFTGELSKHPDGALMRAFLFRHGIEPLCLTDGPLLDIGGILPLMQV